VHHVLDGVRLGSDTPWTLQNTANDPLTTMDAVEVLESLARVPAALSQLLVSAPPTSQCLPRDAVAASACL